MTNSTKNTHVQYINSRIKDRFNGKKSVIFGQNIIAGSRISGLGAGLDSLDEVTALNTPNVENSLMGFGLGMMLNGIDSAFLMKQHDFALLGLDQITNTVNSARALNATASFIVIMVVVDSGFEGPQASLNNLDEFASLSRSPVHYLNSKKNIDSAFADSLEAGLHFMVLSQANMKKELLSCDSQAHNLEYGELVARENSSQVLVVHFGLNTNYLNEVISEFTKIGIVPDYLLIRKIDGNLNVPDEIISRYKSVITINLSKSEISYAERFSFEIRNLTKVTYIKRIPSPSWSHVIADSPEISANNVINLWRQTSDDNK